MSNLQNYFPNIRTKDEILKDIYAKPSLVSMYYSWSKERQQEFLDFCTGIRGIKILYDSFFKEIFNPEYAPERLEEFLSLIMGRKVKIHQILPNDSTRLSDETSLLTTDIVVEFEDGSLANIEIQKIGYLFPGQRCACYSADLLLRQYKRLRSEKKNAFKYSDIKNVYTIVIFETSPREFKKYPRCYLHTFTSMSNSGLQLNLLQDYFFIPLDIFLKNLHDKGIRTKFDAWLTFLTSDEPETIIALITKFPQFKAMYQELYDLCLNVEGVMNMFSKELRELDRNTVQYMIDIMQEEIDQQKAELELQAEKFSQQSEKLEEKTEQLEQVSSQLENAQALNQLMMCLLDDNRLDDLHRSRSDTEFQKQLLKEYHLI